MFKGFFNFFKRVFVGDLFKREIKGISFLEKGIMALIILQTPVCKPLREPETKSLLNRLTKGFPLHDFLIIESLKLGCFRRPNKTQFKFFLERNPD